MTVNAFFSEKGSRRWCYSLTAKSHSAASTGYYYFYYHFATFKWNTFTKFKWMRQGSPWKPVRPPLKIYDITIEVDRKKDCEHGFTSRLITRFAWKYSGSTASFEQRKNIQRFRVNKVSAVIKIFNRSKIRPLPSEPSHCIIWHDADPLSSSKHKQITTGKSFITTK